MNETEDPYASDDRYQPSEKEIKRETSDLIGIIDLAIMSIEEIYDQVEIFIKSLYSSLSALVAYEGTYIQQNEELVKDQKRFLSKYDAETIVRKNTTELGETSLMLSEIVEELDLIPIDEDSVGQENFKGFEGKPRMPYVSKEKKSVSETNSCPSQISGNDLKGLASSDKNIDEIKRNSSSSHENSDESDLLANSQGRPRVESFDKDPKRNHLSAMKAQSYIDGPITRESTTFQKIHFKEIMSTIIDEEKEKFSEKKKESNNIVKDQDGNLSSFEKKFMLEKDERLIDSFTCAIVKKILLHGRLYITNYRL